MKEATGKIVKITKFNLGKSLFQTENLKRLSFFTFYFFLFALGVAAQQEEQPPPDDVAPPPLKLISKAEKTSLAAATDVSERVKLSLALMETRLKNAEESFARDSFTQMLVEFGGFNALIKDALDFLNRNDINRGKVLNNYKRIELSLRKFAPRVEMVRRELPAKYEYWVRSLLKEMRAARSKAVEPLFSDSVLPNQKEN